MRKITKSELFHANNKKVSKLLLSGDLALCAGGATFAKITGKHPGGKLKILEADFSTATRLLDLISIMETKKTAVKMTPAKDKKGNKLFFICPI